MFWCSWKILILSMKGTILSGEMWFPGECIPAVARSGAICRGIGHCAALRMNSSLHVNRSRAHWSVTARSGKNGMFLAHSTAENSNLAANSQIFSMPIIPQGIFIPCWKRAVGYGSARNKSVMKPDRKECPLVSPLTPCAVFCWVKAWVGGRRPRWTAEALAGKKYSLFK